MDQGNKNGYAQVIAAELNLDERSVAGALALLDEGSTVPFIARYRKERTGEMDEEQLRAVRDRLAALSALDDRRQSILKSLRERDMLTQELEQRIRDVADLAKLEDIYLPYRPKRKTRASVAKEQGLEPLAEEMLEQPIRNLTDAARAYVDPDRGVDSVEAALAGAKDIIAERISEDAELRARLRSIFRDRALISSSRKRTSSEQDAKVYRDYFDWREPAKRAAEHRIHAVLRGEREGHLTVHVEPPEDDAMIPITREYVRFSGDQRAQLEQACIDAYRRLLKPSLETEQKAKLKERADRTALGVFASNLRDLLLSPPLGNRAVMGVDPGFRTGCKVVCLDEHGELTHHTAIYPLEPHNRSDEAADAIRGLIEQHGIEAVAIGNGTGGREAETFVRAAVGGDRDLIVTSVNEAGASVYSASEAAREEFPDQDVTVRGAVSIARRLMDPLSELVKIDPKSIGVGQYQHDLDQKLLETGLTDTVVSCVNAVGVELNTASAWLLAYVSGLSKNAARAIVEHRGKHGSFRSRSDLLDVKGIGEKSFQLAAGFLRIEGGTHPLDASAVHPERYPLVERIAKSIGVEVQGLISNRELVERVELSAFADDSVGLPTLRDIRDELLKPGRDPRSDFDQLAFSDDVHDIEDLRIGMKLPGVVTNVTNFGAFVDIGVHRDGLVHISKLADRFVSDPREVVRVNQRLTVTVMEVDADRKRIGLSLVD